MRPFYTLLRGLSVLVCLCLAAPGAQAALTNIAGTAQDTSTILWTWDAIAGATNYEVFDVATHNHLSCTAGARTYYETGLTPASGHAIIVQPACTGILGASLTIGDTFYTWPNVPGTPASPITELSSSGFRINWTANGNPVAHDPEMSYRPCVTRLSDGVQFGPCYNASEDEDQREKNSIYALTYDLEVLSPNTNYSVAVVALNRAGIRSNGSMAASSIYTHAAPPANVTAASGGATSLSVAWTANGNPGTTPYKVTYNKIVNGQPDTTTLSLANTTALTATITGLVTASSYKVYVQAFNHDNVATAVTSAGCASPSGTTCISLIVDASAGGTLDGTIVDAAANLRRMSVTVAGGSFDRPVDVVVLPKTTALADRISNAAAFSITAPSGVEPKSPITISYEVLTAAGETAGVAPGGAARDPSRFALARISDSGKVVPLVTTVAGTANGYLLTAQTNHLSDFIVVQAAATGNLAARTVRPNPLHLSQGQGYMTFEHLPANARVRIFTLRGELVFDGHANASGMMQWSAVNRAGARVGSGIYLAVLEDGGTREIMKLVVIR